MEPLGSMLRTRCGTGSDASFRGSEVPFWFRVHFQQLTRSVRFWNAPDSE